MPYIDKEKFRMHIIMYQHNPLKVKLKDEEKEKFIRMLDEVPTADVVEVVRCKDCEHYREEQIGFVNCLYHLTTVDDDGFCKWGERRTDARMD